MGLVILKKDKENSKSFEESEELARRRYCINKRKTLYKNIRKILNDARKASDDENLDEEYTQLCYAFYAVQRRISELNCNHGIGLGNIKNIPPKTIK